MGEFALEWRVQSSTAWLDKVRATRPERVHIGIDEAGRGCVLGPMVYGAVMFAEGEEPKVKELGCNDSKQLTPKRREACFSHIQQSEHLMAATL
jgi:ribonuclease HII